MKIYGQQNSIDTHSDADTVREGLFLEILRKANQKTLANLQI